MKNLFLAAIVTGMALLAHAEEKKEPTAQQERMATCNKEATGMKGDERKQFMSDCLSGKKPMSQQDRMKKCNADATGKSGDERKQFMSQCLKG